MFAAQQDIVFFPQEASTTARDVDLLLYFLLAVTGAVGMLVTVLLLYFVSRYHRRPDSPRPPHIKSSTALELFWTLTPLAIFLVIFVWGATVYFGAYRAPDDAEVIYGQAKQWMWKFQHHQGQNEINVLHVELGKAYKIVLTSEDVIHSFFVPNFRVHMDVLPGRYTSVWFRATQKGTHHLFCSQYCGTDHAGMIGQVVVMEPAEFQEWSHLNANNSLATRGHQVFLKYRCLSCHSADEHARAPVLEQLYNKEVHYHLRGESGSTQNWRTVRADEDYIRESIYDPGAKIVAGYENIMPTFKGQVSETELIELIAWIRSLQPGQTPKRNEQFPPPVATPPINPKPEK
jgi:cytochrome c oxidase subunit 2